jgi:hypothetical protein
MTLIVVFLGTTVIGMPNYFGFGLLILVSGLKILKVKAFNIIFVLFLLLGTLNIIQFTYFSSNAGVSIGSLQLSFQPISFILLTIFIIINFSKFADSFSGVFATDPAILRNDENERIKVLYEKLKNQKDSKLQEIVLYEKMYQKDYVSAAKKLINERKEGNINISKSISS